MSTEEAEGETCPAEEETKTKAPTEPEEANAEEVTDEDEPTKPEEAINNSKPGCPAKPKEEDEEGLVDPQEKYRKLCRTTKECTKYFDLLTSCNERVTSRAKTAETCMEETIDYVHCVDHCAAKKFFPLLK